jgi:hypothetical protein
MFATVFLLAIVALLVLPGCGTLDKSGVYAGDKTLYDADQVINTSYDALHAFVLFEFQNRAMLAPHPEVKLAADNVRMNARDWLQSAINLREAYAANPTADNANKLHNAIAIIQTALSEATKYLIKYQAPAPPAAP